MDDKASGEGRTKKPVVAIDIDEVLGKFVEQLVMFHNSEYSSKLTPESFENYSRFHEAFKTTKEEADIRVREFFKSAYFLGEEGEGIPPISGAKEVLQAHSHLFDFHVVTSRQLAIEPETRSWLDRHYAGIFTEVHLGNHYATTEELEERKSRSKPAMCSAIDAVLLVDDSPHYALECAAAGLHTVLFGEYAWNRLSSAELPALVTRAHCWEEVAKVLTAL